MFQLVNERFLERCKKYNSCPEDGEDPVFVCQQNQCVSRRETFNCKLEKECIALESQFLCNNGLCQNVSRIMSCQYWEVGPTYDCTDKRNCIMLTGLFHCRNGQCTEVGNTRQCCCVTDPWVDPVAVAMFPSVSIIVPDQRHQCDHPERRQDPDSGVPHLRPCSSQTHPAPVLHWHPHIATQCHHLW